MYLYDYKTIKFEQQERIDKAASLRQASHARRVAKLAVQAERRTRRHAADVERQARHRSLGRLLSLVRRIQSVPS